MCTIDPESRYFGLVVVELATRHHLAGDGRLDLVVAQHADLEFTRRRHRSLDHHLQVELEGEIDRRGELAGRLRLGNADARSEVRRFDEDRKTKRRLNGRDQARAIGAPFGRAEDAVLGDRQTARGERQLHERLVHAHRRCQDTGADIRDVGELEQPLNRAVLAERAMQHGKDDVEAKAGHSGAVVAFIGSSVDRDQRFIGRVGDEMRLAPGADRVRRRQPSLLDHVGCGEHRGRPVGQRPAPVLFDADGDRIVAGAIEVFEDRGGRRDRYFVLAGPAAEDDTNAELLHRVSLKQC